MTACLLAAAETSRQTMFRALLQALSYPGCPVACADLPGPAVFHVLDTMLTQSDTFHVTSAIAAHGEIISSVARRVGASFALPEASCAVAATGGELRLLLPSLRRGSLEYPDEGATLALVVDGIDRPDSANTLKIEFSGPGVPGSRRCRVTGLQAADVAALSEANRAFPQGVDTILIDPSGLIVGVPRSAQLRAI
jgi:phosphonate C-P lyase system protein PhnH